ncbi:MAG: amino acid ABC transporter permease [Alphaproteobacteria bacterium]|nr:amino acid ABC transporter permease [Alphaproteobacteria bacterium]
MAAPPPRQRRARFKTIDWVLLALACGALAWFGWRVANLNNYRWNFDPIPQFFLRWDEATQGWVTNLLLHGLFNTVRLTIFGMVLATAIGFGVGLLRTSRDPFLRLVARSYVELMRNTPPLVIIFVLYFFLSSQLVPQLQLEQRIAATSPETRAVLGVLFGDPRLIENFVAGLLCLALFEAAYIAEIVRAGIEAIPKGQWEAAASLGLSRRRTLTQVILPQAIARTVPPLCNQFVSLVKDSSIVSLVSIQELTFMATDIAVSTTRIYETWLTVAVVYFVVCFALSLVFARVERRYERRR